MGIDPLPATSTFEAEFGPQPQEIEGQLELTAIRGRFSISSPSTHTTRRDDADSEESAA